MLCPGIDTQGYKIFVRIHLNTSEVKHIVHSKTINN